MRGGRRGGRRSFKAEDGLEFLYQRLALNRFLPYSVSFILVIWAIERGVIFFSNWLPLVFAVWATVQPLLRLNLNGKAILYSFVSPPDVRIGVAFVSGGSQSLPATELPGVSSLLVKFFSDTLVKTMVEPRRSCFSLPALDLRKTVVGGVIYVTVLFEWCTRRAICGG